MGKYTYIDTLAELGIGGAHPGGASLTKQLISNQPISTNSVVLDVGCGTGLSSLFISEEFNCKVHALDNKEKMVSQAQIRLEAHPNSQVHFGTVENIPFNDDTFDFILCESVISFLDVEKALMEMYRVLKYNGVLLLNEMTVIDSLSDIEQTKVISFYQFKHLLNEKQWYSILKNRGFYVESEKIQTRSNQTYSEIKLTGKVDKECFDILDEHELLVEQFKDKLDFIVLRCLKI